MGEGVRHLADEPQDTSVPSAATQEPAPPQEIALEQLVVDSRLRLQAMPASASTAQPSPAPERTEPASPQPVPTPAVAAAEPVAAATEEANTWRVLDDTTPSRELPDPSARPDSSARSTLSTAATQTPIDGQAAVEQRLAELHVQLSQTVVEPIERWQLAPLEQYASRLVALCDTPQLREHANTLLWRVRQFQGLQQRHLQASRGVAGTLR